MVMGFESAGEMKKKLLEIVFGEKDMSETVIEIMEAVYMWFW